MKSSPHQTTPNRTKTGTVTEFPGSHSQPRERITPQTLEGEMSTLGAMMMEPDANTARSIIERGISILSAEDFYRQLHRKIYNAIVDLYLDQQPVDLMTVVEELRRKDHLEEVGGAAYLTALIEACPSSANVETYAKAVVEKSVLRLGLKASELLSGAMYGDPDDAHSAFQTVQEMLQKSQSRLAGGAAIPLSLKEIMKMELQEPGWAVPGFIPQGLSILGGMEKSGKSWMALSLCMAVAGGGSFLGHAPAAKGPALYLALEDSLIRMKNRSLKILGSQPPPDDLYVEIEWPRADEGGIERIERWLDIHTTARLVVIDVLQKFRPLHSKSGDIYGEDYAAISALKKIADERNVSIVVLHHLSKRESDDPFRRISGSVGITGSADGMIVLDRKRNKDDALLHITGRDIGTEEYSLQWDRELWSWRLIGKAEDVVEVNTRDQILKLLGERADWFAPRDVQEELSLTPSNARMTLRRMAQEGVLRVQNHTYRLAVDYNTGIGGNKNGTTGAALSAPPE